MAAKKKPPSDKGEGRRAEETEPTILATAFTAVVEAKLDELGHGAKRRLGLALGAGTVGSASSRVHTLLYGTKRIPDADFDSVAEFLGMKSSDLLDLIADWLREHGL